MGYATARHQRGHKPYRSYLTVTREQAFARGFGGLEDWLHIETEYAVARDLIQQADAIQLKEDQATVSQRVEVVDFCYAIHNTGTTRYKPAPGAIVHCKRLGRKPIVRVG